MINRTVSGFQVGCNLSGLEVGNDQKGTQLYPGVAYTDYGVPSTAELDYLAGKGFRLIRLPFLWQRMQPTLDGALNPAYLDLVQTLTTHAVANGQQILLDCHNFGGRSLADGSSGNIGTATVPTQSFASFWKLLANVLAGNPGIAGYDICNEPVGVGDAGLWQDIAQTTILAIRSVDPYTRIYVEGAAWSSAINWTASNPKLHLLQDPSDRLVFSAHCYLDRDSSGTHFVWAQEAAAGVTVQTGVERLTDFLTWLATHNLRGHIGEIGCGNDDPSWFTSLDNTLSLLRIAKVPVTYWAAGPWWGAYPMSIEPNNGVDAPQMATLVKYVN